MYLRACTNAWFPHVRHTGINTLAHSKSPKRLPRSRSDPICRLLFTDDADSNCVFLRNGLFLKAYLLARPDWGDPAVDYVGFMRWVFGPLLSQRRRVCGCR